MHQTLIDRSGNQVTFFHHTMKIMKQKLVHIFPFCPMQPKPVASAKKFLTGKLWGHFEKWSHKTIKSSFFYKIWSFSKVASFQKKRCFVPPLSLYTESPSGRHLPIKSTTKSTLWSMSKDVLDSLIKCQMQSKCSQNAVKIQSNAVKMQSKCSQMQSKFCQNSFLSAYRLKIFQSCLRTFLPKIWSRK